MKVILTCNTGLGTGGQGVCLANAAAGFNELADLTVICADVKTPQTDFSVYPVGYSASSRRLLATPLLRRRNDWAVLLSDLYFDKQVSKKLQLLPCDLIMGVAGQTHLAFKTAKAKGAKAWLYCLNNYLPFMQEQIQQELQFLGESTVATMNPKMLQRFSQECKQADLIVVLSKVAKQTFIDAGFSADKITVLPPFINTERFYPSLKTDSTFRALYVGTIEPRKGVQYLIPAFLQAKIPNSELLLVGGTSTRKMRLLVEKTLSQNSHIKQEFWNFNSQDPQQVFSRCSVFILPSVEDGFGLVALEAMACGLPVIVTSHCGAADLIEDGVNGFIVPPRDEKAITEKLDFLAANESIRIEMSKAARNTAVTYTQELYKQNLCQIFDNYL
ncbi:glycosyltransferase family 4 protein [Hassallia byssoidea VB512170]|uniref:Glycosyltransferase family 4 protein n=1 Tax=Hassallia byssoidea VB512170 TaxID=1304833 RepID=A0A846H3L0_9CYAN|nr:glycosyltransferase family 4 protein [Hassalia byssoidea]NEU71169.1 glycosyltransferase family 4 protein [Hassalia byssoidea VB512170]